MQLVSKDLLIGMNTVNHNCFVNYVIFVPLVGMNTNNNFLITVFQVLVSYRSYN